MNPTKYFVYYIVSKYEHENWDEFDNKSELYKFLNTHEKFYHLKIVRGQQVNAKPYESVTKWRLEDDE